MDGGLEDPLTMLASETTDREAWRADDPVLLVGLLLVAVEFLALFVLVG
ncbi:hypothetical protein GCM10009037_16250 [Halarchaeum grantii]|uniref:Uncharacterized protein n=2 Tax=Halarchaeum grantii TaxID=1193105 RepID=A0A830EV32_9EURY|nr:hypothetical protein GCM10009037_16250 [Halarchaeum grantii]